MPVGIGIPAPVSEIANLETRSVVGRPAAVPMRAEFRFGVNSGTRSASTMRPRRCLLVPVLTLASTRPALSLP